MVEVTNTAAAAEVANIDNQNQQTSKSMTSREGERKEQTNVGKFVHFSKRIWVKF
jgi:hypothetical protein